MVPGNENSLEGYVGFLITNTRDKMFRAMIKITVILVLFGLAVPFSVSSQEVAEGDQLGQSVKDIESYSELIEQINSEKALVKGIEARALAKQLLLTQEIYRSLLWKLVDDWKEAENKAEYEQVAPFISAQLLLESKAIKEEINIRLAEASALEDKIISGKTDFGIGGQDKLAALKTYLSKNWKAQEKLYVALVKNAQKIVDSGGVASEDISFVKSLIKKQADVLSGTIRFDKDNLAKLEKKLSYVSSESSTGKNILADIRAQNVLVQDDARRLETMAQLLESMDIDASLYKKTVLLSGPNLSSGIFDQKVISHLFTAWWIDTKKVVSKRGPEIFGKIATFIIVLVLAFFMAIIVRKMIRKVLLRTLPDMSELAKNFIVSMSSKVVILGGFLLALSNIGVQIGPLLAGLGIIGFVVGFALQDTLSNFASGLMILIYRPYDVGDKIISAGVKGKVSKMNLVSTTIYTSENHQLTVPNKKIWGDIIHNVTSQPLQRLDLYFKVPFSADSGTVLAAITDVVENCPNVLDDRDKTIRIHELGEIDVKYLARFWVATDDLYEAQWSISEGVKKSFDEKGISLSIMESIK